MCFYNFFTMLSNLELSPPNLRASEGIVTLIFLFNISILRQISIQHLLCTDWASAFGTACLMSQAQLQLQIMMLSIAQSCLTLCAPMDCSLWGSSVHGIFQARILEWASISSSTGYHNPGIKPMPPAFLYWQAESLPLSHLGSPHDGE